MRNSLRNIREIIKGDFEAFRHNVVAWVIIVGLAVIPSLYAWFNISASWDPYGNTGQLKVAIANDDEGYNGELSPISINMGEEIIAAIRENNSFDWTVTDSKTAAEGVKSGKYYAAIVVPEEFSDDMMSLFSENVKEAKLIYYCNQKENAIVGKVTGKGADYIQESVREDFTKTMVEVLLNVMKNVTSGEDGDRYALEAVKGLVSELQQLDLQVQTLQSTIASLRALISTINVTADTYKDSAGITRETIEIARKILEKVDRPEADKALADIDDARSTLADATAQTKADIDSMDVALASTQVSLQRADRSLGDLIDRIQEALDSEDLDTIKDILGANVDDLSSFLAAPVNLEENRIYPVENYGAAMAPFYTSLAIWVGGTILAALLLVQLSEERRKKLKNLTYTQEYIGRYVLFLVIGLIQAFIICGGNLWYLGMGCAHPLLFIFAGLVSSVVFVNFAYTLTASFGDVGKAICVIMLVIQVAGSGGTFPIEMEPDLFRMIYPLLPFAHSMAAMREAIAGTYGNVYWKELGILMIYFAGCLVLGLVLRRPIIRISRSLREKLEDTKVI